MNAVTDLDEPIAAPPSVSRDVRPFFWSIRRELWEHRSLIITPLVTVGVIIASFLLAAMTYLSGQIHVLSTWTPARQSAYVTGMLLLIGVLLLVIMSFAVFFYCLESLHSERKDRSILFWKSMPVSDTTAVLSKLFTATLVAGGIAFVCTLVAQLLVLLIATITALVAGISPASIWSNVQIFQLAVFTLYMLLAAALWYAPIAAWLLLVSAWAKRSVILWAVIPPVAVTVLERVAFGTKNFAGMLEYRWKHGLLSAFQGDFLVEAGPGEMRMDSQRFPHDVIDLLNPVGLLANPWLWVGLLAAAVFVAAAIWVRRYREPI
jgi:ABC-2 type transport system permease protein